jgi:hypothetical protein
MKVKGKRVLVKRPIIEKSAIELTPEAQEDMLKRSFEKWTRLEVYAIGEEVVGIYPGDKVMLTKSAIEGSEVVTVEDQSCLVINESSIMIVW